MQMSISQTATNTTQAATSSSGTKGSDANNFVQTLVQTINGAAAGTDQSNVQIEATSVPAAATALQSLLGNNLSATDLLSVIEQLLSKLGANDEQNGETKASESDLTDALKQLDDLLALLGGMPLIPITNQPDVNKDANTDLTTGGALDGDAGSVANAVTNVTEQQAALLASINAQVSQVKTSVEASSNPENIVVLKADLQEALKDLRSFLQQGKNSLSNRDQLSLIGKQLSSIQQLLESVKPETPVLVNVPSSNVTDVLRTLQTASATNTHLNRMANQLMHVGLLAVVPSQEEQSLSGEQTLQAVNGEALQAVNGNQELLRQIQNTVKPTLQQPVPVQEFAETVQGLVVKQFSVTKSNGVSEARIMLYPEHLGQVDVRISVINGLLTAHFQTDTVAAKDMLENQMAQLRSALQSQGLQVDKLEVSQAAQQSNLFQDRQGQSGKDQQASKRNKSNDDSIGEINFSTDLEEIKVEQAVDRDMGLGRGIHTTA
ncbi:hypothetical protein Back11_22160 [Paenibacillus baekrokdamisoli]|uniref:Uncharacterized protein n=1 Tax=Paenibacillus baekrokdamisoli TaxID=1712516 RepID=A0A3G9J556_9BACL|nr:flagellar hook-length control protein FliK [Paenibacillus baekrokdamisoli]MBB3069775.1 flagellar hook-length control protein FliK [Paenibacillus baekrokdamisoli]BBH20871.1 hypothetical protein Back11_22160 [Paenibacillus baekrokdamisoli]